MSATTTIHDLTGTECAPASLHERDDLALVRRLRSCAGSGYRYAGHPQPIELHAAPMPDLRLGATGRIAARKGRTRCLSVSLSPLLCDEEIQL